MRLSLISLITGLCLIVSAVLFSGLIMSGYWVEYGVDGDQGVIISSNPGGFTTAVNWAWIYFSSGVVVLVSGIWSFFTKKQSAKKRLANIQFTLGVMIIILLVVYMVFIEPDWLPYLRYMENFGHQILIKHDTTWIVQQLTWKITGILLGLGVVVLGYIQLRKQKNAPYLPPEGRYGMIRPVQILESGGYENGETKTRGTDPD